jgi:hypothetical protein
VVGCSHQPHPIRGEERKVNMQETNDLNEIHQMLGLVALNEMMEFMTVVVRNSDAYKQGVEAGREYSKDFPTKWRAKFTGTEFLLQDLISDDVYYNRPYANTDGNGDTDWCNGFWNACRGFVRTPSEYGEMLARI